MLPLHCWLSALHHRAAPLLSPWFTSPDPSFPIWVPLHHPGPPAFPLLFSRWSRFRPWFSVLLGLSNPAADDYLHRYLRISRRLYPCSVWMNCALIIESSFETWPCPSTISSLMRYPLILMSASRSARPTSHWKHWIYRSSFVSRRTVQVYYRSLLFLASIESVAY